MPSDNLSKLSKDQIYHIRQRVLSVAQEYMVTCGDNQPVCFATRSRYYLRSLAIGVLWLTAVITCIGVLIDAAPGSYVLAILILTGAVGFSCFLYPKRHIEFFADEAKKNLLWRAEQESKMQFIFAHYRVKTADGTVLGRISKNHFTDFLRKKWTCRDEQDNVIFFAYEDSIILALLRRFLGNFYGLLRTHFIYTTPEQSIVIADFNRDFTLRDHYTLKLDPAPVPHPDGRLLLTMGVILDTGERR